MIEFYEEFAPFYDRWVGNDILAKYLTQVYSDYIFSISEDTSVIYLGVATGRIALSIAEKNPKHRLIGVDNSKKMLELCAKNFQESSVNIKLLRQDILDLRVQTKKNVFLLPFRTIGHFISLESKTKVLSSIYKAMKKNERLVFDFDTIDMDLANKTDNKHTLTYHDEKSNIVIYNKFNFDYVLQEIKVSVYSAKVNNDALANLKTYNYEFSWVTDKQMRKILQEIGFEILSVSENSINYIFEVQKNV